VTVSFLSYGEEKLLCKSAIILAGGESRRFGEDKGTVNLAGKPLINWVVDSVRQMVNEIVVVTCCRERIAKYAELVGPRTKLVVDERESKGPLIGAYTGFNAATSKYALLLPIDTPFVSKQVVSLLFDLAEGRTATIPRWPNGQIEPLYAVYRTKAAVEAAKSAIEEGELDMRSMIERMQGVRYVSTLVIEQIDPELKTLFNINTLFDLKKAVTLIGKKRIQ